MLFQPVGAGVFFRACEADSWRGLVAAILDDPEYETPDLETRLVHRLRLADDVVLLAELDEMTANPTIEGTHAITVRTGPEEI